MVLCDVSGLLVAKLATDPKSKVDLMQSIDNIKDATTNVFESITSPVYHIRDAIGSARDVVFSVMKGTPTGLLIPSNYGIMELRPNPEVVGGINPEISKYDTNGKPFPIESQQSELSSNQFHDKNTGETLTAVQFMLKNGFRKAKDSVQHAGDAVHSMRRAVLTVPHSFLKLFYPFYKSIELDYDKDKYKPTGLLGTKPVVPDPTPRLVGAGRLIELIRAAASDEEQKEDFVGNVKSAINNGINKGINGGKEILNPVVGNVKNAISEGKEKYQNIIKKLREEAKGRLSALNYQN